MTALAAITSMAQSAKAIGPAFQMAGQMMKQAISDLWTWFKTKFIDPVMNGISEIGDFFIQVVLIALIFLIVAFPCTGTWLFFGGWLKKILKNPYHQKIFNIIMASLLVLSLTPSVYDLIQEYIN